MSGWRISNQLQWRWQWRVALAAVVLLSVPAASLDAQPQRADPWVSDHDYGIGHMRADLILSQCLERVRITPDARPGDCVNAVFLTCESEHGNMSQRDLNDCAAFSRRAWEKRLENVRSQLLGARTIDPKFGEAGPMVARLQESERRWQEWNEADCELQAGDAERGGTMRSMQRDLCFSNHAAHRALELEALIFWWEKSFKL